MWDWGSSKHYLHDAISSDKRDPTVNANGPIYGSPEESTDLVPVLDPLSNKASEILHPYRDPKTPSARDLPAGTSVYWGDEPIWDGHTSIHNPIMDRKGRVWFTARIRPAANPDFCRMGSDHPSAKVVPLDDSARQLSMYDPKSGKWSLIDTCFTTQHLYFANDPNNTLWTSAGGPQSGVVGWLNTRKYEETGDEAKSQGWTPIILDTNGNGKRDAYVEADQPVDPTKDKRVMAAFYGVQPSPVDDSIWGQSMDIGFSGIDQPGYIIRLVPGSSPSETALAEIYVPPDEGYGPRGLDLDLNGVVWTVAVERASRELRPHQVQGAAQRRESGDRQAMSGRLDALSIPGTAVQGRHRPGERRSRLLRMGRSLQYAGARAERADRVDQWRRVAPGARGRQVDQSAGTVPNGLLHQERGRPHRQQECRLEGSWIVDDVRLACRVP